MDTTHLGFAAVAAATATVTMSHDDLDSSNLRRGPWTVEEDTVLTNYIAIHGEGRWNSLSRNAGLRRTGKSCRLRWLNYLRPDVRRGNLTAQEQLLILELHSRWGNRWSKIAQYLPGRTDNEIKNYWRTRVQKHARQLRCDVNSKQFRDMMRYLWMPRLVERIHAAATITTPLGVSSPENCTSTTNECSSIVTDVSSQEIPPAATVATSGWATGAAEGLHVQPLVVPEPWENDYGCLVDEGLFVATDAVTTTVAADVWTLEDDLWSTLQEFQHGFDDPMNCYGF